MKNLFLVCILGYFSNQITFAQNWELKKIGEGIKVYTRPESGTSFNSFKAEMEILAKPEQVRYILSHMHLYPDLFPDTKELKILARPNDSTLIQYTHTATPWPLDDRDGIYQLNFKSRADGGFEVKSEAKPNYLPEKPSFVRIQKSNSSWEIIPNANGMLKITYVVNAEPGGNLPQWLVNAAATEIPYQTFVNLKQLLKKI